MRLTGKHGSSGSVGSVPLSFSVFLQQAARQDKYLIKVSSPCHTAYDWLQLLLLST